MSEEKNRSIPFLLEFDGDGHLFWELHSSSVACCQRASRVSMMIMLLSVLILLMKLAFVPNGSFDDD